MQLSRTDTIAAIATPPGLGGISILRISGPDALSVLRTLFQPTALRNGRESDATTTAHTTPFHFKARYMHYGFVVDENGTVLDEALAVYMPGPRSFTGEDVAEIHSHGGVGVSTAILEAAQVAGARLAGPGEFSRRAFFNGRMDLTQAEAIAEIISAPGKEGARLAAAKMEGALSARIADLRNALDAMRMQVILAVDFPEEDAELLSVSDFFAAIEKARASIEALLHAFERARLWREGALAVLSGRVNAGKSSLLNALLGRERAIVSPLPGTTRDYIEESINLRGLSLRLSDTAGLRQGGDLIEEEGIRRSRSLAEEAEVILFVVQAGEPLSDEERDFLRKQERRMRQGRIILVANKIDLLLECGEEHNSRSSAGGMSAGAPISPGELLHCMGLDSTWAACPLFAVSAKLGTGLQALCDGIRRSLTGTGQETPSEGLSDSGTVEIAPNLRQAKLLQQADGELEALTGALASGLPQEFLGVHLDAAIAYLDEISGNPDNMELLDRIFADFCIGK